MTSADPDNSVTYPVRVAARMTGLTPELIRAWESRYGAVQPTRSAGGTRRYSTADLERLTLLRRVVEAGHKISKVAVLDLEDLRSRLPACDASTAGTLERALIAVERLDQEELRLILSEYREAVGPVEFGRTLAIPLLVEVGRRWQEDGLTVGAEHLVSSLLRSMLTAALVEEPDSGPGPRMVFATPSGETHDLGLLVSALVAQESGAKALFLGADVPEADLVASVERARGEVLVLGIVTLATSEAQAFVQRLREALPDRIALWVGGAGIAGWPALDGIQRLQDLDAFKAHVVERSRVTSVGPARVAATSDGRG